MDIHLPGIDGPEATRRILTDVVWPKAPPIVFLLSTYDATDYAAEESWHAVRWRTCRRPNLVPAALVAAWAAAQQCGPLDASMA